MDGKPLPQLNKVRLSIARRVHQLRTERRWTQGELARRLGVSQNHVSDLERGRGSFTAEQLLALLGLFNVPASSFLPSSSASQGSGAELQNALSRLGAAHLREIPDVVPSDALEAPGDVIREALLADSARHVTALAPVLVANVDRVNLRRIFGELADAGLDRRFAWVVDNTVEALHIVLPRSTRGEWTQRARRAETLLAGLRGFLVDHHARGGEAPDDVLDPDINNARTLEQVKRGASEISKRWGVVSSLQPADFVEAIEEARGAR
jgi:transcriptional regulator with XRE-family HTH domain